MEIINILLNFPVLLLITIGFVISIVFGCCVCLCCGLPALQVVGTCCLGTALTNYFCCNSSRNKRNKTVVINTNTYYEMVSQQGTSVAEESNVVPVAEAYWVAPLAAARIEPNIECHPLMNQQNVSPYGPGYAAEPAAANQGEEDVTVPKFQDRWAAYLFIANAIVILTLAVRSLMSHKSLVLSSASSLPAGTDMTNSPVLYVGTLVGLLFTFLIAASISGTVFLYSVIHYPAEIIEAILIGSILFWIFGGFAVFFATESMFGLGMFALLAVCSAWYYFSVRNRIPFASAVLATASRAIKQNYWGVMFASYGMLVAQALWIGIWIIAAYGVYADYSVQMTSNHDDEASKDRVPKAIVGLLLLSLYWGIQLIKSILQCTVSGTVGSWWFQPTNELAVRGALLRSTTTSFGSLCFGSLLVAIVHTLRELLAAANKKRRQRNGRDAAADCAKCILDRLLQWMESLLIYFNKYAFCYVAAYGLSFIESGRRVSELFYKRGWTAIINDNLVSNALSLGIFVMSLGMALLGMGVGYFVRSSTADYRAMTVLGAVGACVGAAVGTTIFGALESGVAMVFVCLADDASTLLKNHPHEYSSLAQAWGFFNSGVVDWRVDIATPVENTAAYVAPAATVFGYNDTTSPSPYGMNETYNVGAAGVYEPGHHQPYAHSGTVIYPKTASVTPVQASAPPMHMNMSNQSHVYYGHGNA